MHLEDSTSKMNSKKRYYVASEDDEGDVTNIKLAIDDEKHYRSDDSIDLIKESPRVELRKDRLEASRSTRQRLCIQTIDNVLEKST